MMRSKVVLGPDTHVEIAGYKKIPAKIDTGADGSSIWASKIRVTPEGRLLFCLFGQNSPFYDGKTIQRRRFSAAKVKTASGEVVLKFRVHLTVKIKGRKIKALFGLSDRSNLEYPVLIGKRTLKRRFVVDVAQSPAIGEKKTIKCGKLTKNLKKDPHKFYQDYYLKTKEK